MTPHIERALDVCSEQLITWGGHRLDAADQEWLEALRGEMGEIDSAWQRLAWAAGGLEIVWGRHRGMRWVRMAGGLGGWRTYPWGLALGILLLVRASADWHTRDENVTLRIGELAGVTLPSLLQLLILATVVLAGAAAYTAARRTGTVVHGVLVGGLTGAVGVGVCVVGRLAEGLLGQVGVYDVAYDMMLAMPASIGITMIGFAAGAVCGALAAPRSIIRAAQAARGDT